MKKNIFIIFFTLAFILSASSAFAGDKKVKGAGLELKTATHTDKGIKINYPQISLMADAEKMAKINALIKNDALAIKSPFDEELKNLEMEANFTVEYNEANILSVKYSIFANVKNAAHPVDMIHAANIDLNAMKMLKLSDVVTIDESLVEKFLKGKYTKRGEDLDLESADALKDVIAGFDKKELLDGFKDPSAAFYFTKDSLVISAGVIHALGDHAEFAISYNDLGKAMVFKPGVSSKSK